MENQKFSKLPAGNSGTISRDDEADTSCESNQHGSASLLSSLPLELLFSVAEYLPRHPLQYLLLSRISVSFHQMVVTYERLLLANCHYEKLEYDALSAKGNWETGIDAMSSGENLRAIWRKLVLQKRRRTSRINARNKSSSISSRMASDDAFLSGYLRGKEISSGALQSSAYKQQNSNNTSSTHSKESFDSDEKSNGTKSTSESDAMTTLTPYNLLCFKYFDPYSPIYSNTPSNITPWFSSLKQYIEMERYMFSSHRIEETSQENLHLLHKLQDIVMQPFRYFTFCTLFSALILLACIIGQLYDFQLTADITVHTVSLLFQVCKVFVGELLVCCAYMILESILSPKSEKLYLPAFWITAVVCVFVFIFYWFAQRIFLYSTAKSIQSAVSLHWIHYPIALWTIYKLFSLNSHSSLKRYSHQLLSFILFGGTYFLFFLRLDDLLVLNWTFVLLPVFVWDCIFLFITIRDAYSSLAPLGILSFMWLKFVFCSGQLEEWGFLSVSPMLIIVLLFGLHMTLVA